MLYNILLILYFAGTLLGLWFVFKKAGVAPWKALIPIYNIVVWIKVCGKSWKWYIYFLIPAINVFCFLLMVVETAKVFRRYGFVEQLVAVIFPWIYLPVLGLSKKSSYHDPMTDPPAKVSEARDWADAIVFALVAATIIRGNIFELYNIPSSSMEKSLQVGDYLVVSKLAYGPRVEVTPLSLPLVHNTIPLTGDKVESYLKWIKLPYHRYPGYTHIKRYDAVVFNFPAGDTTLHASPGNQFTYYDAVRDGNQELLKDGWFTRPVDKRTNYIKRCIGMPGDDLQIIDQVVYINGKPIETPRESQTTYSFLTNVKGFPPQYVMQEMDRLGVSYADIDNSGPFFIDSSRLLAVYTVPLTRKMASRLAYTDMGSFLHTDTLPAETDGSLFPNMVGYPQSVDNFGPIHIPAKGEVVKLNDSILPYYRRLITVYENNTLEVKDGVYYINGEATDSYTVKQNYYWMMGDNRHHSQDSRFWGYVPEDHIAGKALFIYFSWDKDHKKIRWDRMFKKANDR